MKTLMLRLMDWLIDWLDELQMLLRSTHDLLWDWNDLSRWRLWSQKIFKTFFVQIVSIGIIYVQKRRGKPGSAILFIFWLAMLIVGIIRYRTLIERATNSVSQHCSAVHRLYFSIIIMLLDCRASTTAPGSLSKWFTSRWFWPSSHCPASRKSFPSMPQKTKYASSSTTGTYSFGFWLFFNIMNKLYLTETLPGTVLLHTQQTDVLVVYRVICPRFLSFSISFQFLSLTFEFLSLISKILILNL